VALSSFTLVEGMLGMFTKNVHVLRDAFNITLLILALSFATHAIDVWNET